MGVLTCGRVALSRRLTTVSLVGLGDLAITVDDCGALGECDRLAGLAVGGFLYDGSVRKDSGTINIAMSVGGSYGGHDDGPPEDMDAFCLVNVGLGMTYGISHDCGCVFCACCSWA